MSVQASLFPHEFKPASTPRIPALPGVYAIRHVASGKLYVGSAIKLRNRLVAHRFELRRGTHYNKHLQRAWNQYEEGAFTFVILEFCDEAACVDREQDHIDHHRACDPRRGYNRRPKANSNLGLKLSAETRAKMSASHRAFYADPERSRKQRESNRSDEARKRNSEAIKKAWQDPEKRERMTEAIRKRCRDQAERGDAPKRVFSPEGRAGCSAGAKRRFARPEERQKNTERLRKLRDDPAYREKFLQAQRRRREREAKEKSERVAREALAKEGGADHA